MSRSRLLLAWTLVTLQFPGTPELIENVAHFVNHGHWSFLEATGQHHHHAQGSDGCCNSDSHALRLNLSPPVTLVGKLPDLHPTAGGRLARIGFEARGPREGHLPSLFRPPIATV